MKHKGYANRVCQPCGGGTKIECVLMDDAQPILTRLSQNSSHHYPQVDGAISVFAPREATKEFAKGDSFLVNGLVRSWKVLDSNESRAELPASAAT